MKPITKEWLGRASDDLDAIEQLLKKEHLTNVVAFHAQQAVEKTLKAVIEELEIVGRGSKPERLKKTFQVVHDQQPTLMNDTLGDVMYASVPDHSKLAEEHSHIVDQ